MKEPAATIWRELPSRTTLEDEPLPAMTSISIPRSQNTPGALGANYLYTWLSSPTRTTNPTSPIDLPLLSKKRLGAQILHPEIIEAAVLTYQTSTEVLATLLICLRTYNIISRRKVSRNFPHYYTNQSQPKYKRWAPLQPRTHFYLRSFETANAHRWGAPFCYW